MAALYPLIFRPIFKQRVWGNRNLERLYGKQLPPNEPIGESWEISDRPGDVSVIANGPLAGKDLHWLMEHHAKELLGETPSANGRFPLLTKIRNWVASLKPKCGTLLMPSHPHNYTSVSNEVLRATYLSKKLKWAKSL